MAEPVFIRAVTGPTSSHLCPLYRMATSSSRPCLRHFCDNRPTGATNERIPSPLYQFLALFTIMVVALRIAMLLTALCELDLLYVYELAFSSHHIL